MRWLGEFLVRYPELALFLALGVGHLIGNVKYRGFGLGPVTGSLVAGILIGQFGDIPVSAVAKSFLFMLFLFGIGYTVGPQFGRAIKGEGVKALALGVFVPVVGLVTAYAMAKLLNLDLGLATGLVSGGLTESAAMGTGAEVIASLPLPEAERSRLIGHIGVADSLCYLFGAFGVIVFCSEIGPRLLRIDLKEEAKKLEAAYGMQRAAAGESVWRMFEARAYRFPNHVGRTVADIEALAQGFRLFTPRLRRDGKIIRPELTTVLVDGDIVGIAGARKALVEKIGTAGVEVEDRELLDVQAAVVDIFVTSKEVEGKTLGELAPKTARGVFLKRMTRGGVDIPVTPGTVVQRGDVVTLVGNEQIVARATKRIGFLISPVEVPDYVTIGFAIFFGAMAGVLITVPIGSLKVSLSTSVGVLLAGLTVGWLRTRHPLLGRIPDQAVAMMTSLGLAAFVAMIGLHAGPVFLDAVKQYGVSLLLAGVVVTMMPLILGLYFGRYVLRMNPLLLLGALSGAQTMTPALAAVQEKSGSPIAVLGYAAAVPLGHILLTVWGSVIVLLLQ